MEKEFLIDEHQEEILQLEKELHELDGEIYFIVGVVDYHC